MGTTLVGGIVVGNEMVFAHCGDSRAYIVRDGIAMQLTEDHTLLARLLAAGVDVDTDGEGSRFKSMLTNALGIGQECKASTFVVPLADGNRFLLCSDGITEYVRGIRDWRGARQVGVAARAAQKLVEMALDRGGGDNATALVVRVLEAGEVSRPSEELRRERPRSTRAAVGEGQPAAAAARAAHRVAARSRGRRQGAGEDARRSRRVDHHRGHARAGRHDARAGLARLSRGAARRSPLPDKDGLAIAKTEVRALALRSDDFGELCEDDPDLAEQLMAALGDEIANRAKRKLQPMPEVDWCEQRSGRPPDPNVESREDARARRGRHRSREDARAAGHRDPQARQLAHVDAQHPAEDQSEGRADRPRVDRAAGAAGSAEPRARRRIRRPTDRAGRSRTNTDLGATPLPRPPALPSLPNPFRQHPRGSTPPSEKSIRPPPRPRPPSKGDGQAQRRRDVGRASRRGRGLAEDEARGPGTQAHAAGGHRDRRRGRATTAPVMPSGRSSRSRRSRSRGSPRPLADDDEPAEIVMTVEDGSARVTEIVKDTSSQTMTVTVEEPPEPRNRDRRPGRAITTDDDDARRRRDRHEALEAPDRRLTRLRPVVLVRSIVTSPSSVCATILSGTRSASSESQTENVRGASRTRRQSGARDTTRRRCGSRGDCRSRADRLGADVRTSTRHSRRPPTTNTVRVCPAPGASRGSAPSPSACRERCLAEVDVERVRGRIAGAVIRDVRRPSRERRVRGGRHAALLDERVERERAAGVHVDRGRGLVDDLLD